jgi:hypothetical protein
MGAPRRPRRRAKRQAMERIYTEDMLGQPFRPLERGRGHRSAMSLPLRAREALSSLLDQLLVVWPHPVRLTWIEPVLIIFARGPAVVLFVPTD